MVFTTLWTQKRLDFVAQSCYIQIYEYYLRGIVMKITDAAKAALEPILAQNPGKMLRVVFEGFG